MSEATAEQAILNGTGPAPQADEPCTDCVTTGEKLLAVLGIAFAVFLLAMSIDMFSGGKLGGMVKGRTSG